MNTKNNARYSETDKKIREVFLAELDHTPIDNIKVSHICQVVNINRSSFYAHYEDIYDLLQAISDEVGQQLFQRLESIDFFNSDDIVSKEALLIILKHMFDNKKFYTAYFSSVSLERMNKGLDNAFESIIKFHLAGLGVEEETAVIHFVFFKAGLLAVIKYWLQTDCAKSPEEISEIIWKSIRERTSYPKR